MSDQATFAAFASSGAFTGDPALSLPQQVDQISNGLQLFVLSKALVGNKYKAQIIPVSSIEPGSEDSLCVYKGQDICYHDDTLLGGVVFLLEKTDAMDGIHGAEMASKIIQGGWATPQQLYRGAFDCAASGNFGQTVVNLDGPNTFDVSCLSQLDECYFGSNCATALVNGGCPVQTCPTGY